MAVGILEVKLVKAKGLGNPDFFGLSCFCTSLTNMDPYVLVQYKSQERKSKVARGQGGRPVWNETLTFKVEFPGQDGNYKLILKIMDKDTFSSDDSESKNGTAELQTQKYRVVNADKSYRGEIQVGVTFTLKAEEEDAGEDYGGWKQSSV
ncbi:16 KDA PHLOEM PROTEIN 1 [Salix koriyanagi]|uniref:16 kDa PHLOEM PROTEIN 1 n=1 Tax=Salix koriyanagi TaxID=2511006 RepID=A0A9Q0WSR8_9ROSI|nr:16 KDA PHLOEM PROTEIN 1 [Salix koriyanagi]